MSVECNITKDNADYYVEAYTIDYAVGEDKVIKKIGKKNSLADFNIGYVTTVFLGICFMALGALVMFHSSEEIRPGASAFAQQLISLYTSNLGKGAAVFIGIAAFTTMFSTTLTTLDASPRAMARSTELLTGRKNRNFYLIWIIILSLGTMIILSYFKTSMTIQGLKEE